MQVRSNFPFLGRLTVEMDRRLVEWEGREDDLRNVLYANRQTDTHTHDTPNRTRGRVLFFPFSPHLQENVLSRNQQT